MLLIQQCKSCKICFTKKSDQTYDVHFQQNALCLLINGLASYKVQYSIDIETGNVTQLSGLK